MAVPMILRKEYLNTTKEKYSLPKEIIGELFITKPTVLREMLFQEKGN